MLGSVGARRYGLWLGTPFEYGEGHVACYGRVSGIINEDTPCSPVLEYGISKLRVRNEAPAVADKLRMEYVHARYFSVYGPNDHPYTLVPSCIRAFLRNETIELSECRHKWNFMHVGADGEARWADPSESEGANWLIADGGALPAVAEPGTQVHLYAQWE